MQLENTIGNGVGDVPDILIDSQMCEIYHCTWQEWQDTPLYVRQAFTLIQGIKAEAAANDR